VELVELLVEDIDVLVELIEVEVEDVDILVEVELILLLVLLCEVLLIEVLVVKLVEVVVPAGAWVKLTIPHTH
jgi:hypothetical protein